MEDPWARAGASLAQTVDHIWVLTLPGASTRVATMRRLLEHDLGLPSSMITFFEGAACSTSWGRWPSWLQALQSRSGSQSHASNWWMASTVCDDDDAHQGGRSPPGCVQSRYRDCIGIAPGAKPPAVCNEVCYTLSVIGAMQDFLQRNSNVQRALILEDDVCATTALLSISSTVTLRWLATHRTAWDLVKLGDCFRGFKAFFGVRRRIPAAEVMTTGTCASRGAARASMQFRAGGDGQQNNSLLHRLPWAFCTHAIAVSRPMAAHLVSQAFPATDVFDNLLVTHIAPQIRRHGHAFNLWSFNLSLFAQIGKVTPARILPTALLSYERVVGQQGPGARVAAGRKRRRPSTYRPARPLG